MIDFSPFFFFLAIFLLPAFLCSGYTVGLYLALQKIPFSWVRNTLPPVCAAFLIALPPVFMPVIIESGARLVASLVIPGTLLALGVLMPMPLFAGRMKSIDGKMAVLICGTLTYLLFLVVGSAMTFGSGYPSTRLDITYFCLRFIPETVPFRWFVVEYGIDCAFGLIVALVVYSLLSLNRIYGVSREDEKVCR